MWKVSDSKAPCQEGAVPGRCEGQVGTCSLVQNVQWVGQGAGVEALLCHPHFLLFEGLCGGQRLLGTGGRVRGSWREGDSAQLVQGNCLNFVKEQVWGKGVRGQGLGEEVTGRRKSQARRRQG